MTGRADRPRSAACSMRAVLAALLLMPIASARAGVEVGSDGLGAARGVQVPPMQARASLDDVHEMVALGTVDIGAAARLRVSFVGTLTGVLESPGQVGVLLLPDVPAVQSALTLDRRLLLPIRAEASIEPRDRLFAGSAPEVAPRFPRYRAWLYNRTTQGMSLDVYFFVPAE